MVNLHTSTESGESVDSLNMYDYLKIHTPFDLDIHVSEI